MTQNLQGYFEYGKPDTFIESSVKRVTDFSIVESIDMLARPHCCFSKECGTFHSIFVVLGTL